MTVTFQVVYWRDIPSQVKVKAGRVRSSLPLSDRFQVAIDRAAMRAGLFNSDDYLNEWRSTDSQERAGEADAVAAAVAAELEAAFPDDKLEQIASAGGRLA
jgi:hypothetical protein